MRTWASYGTIFFIVISVTLIIIDIKFLLLIFMIINMRPRWHDIFIRKKGSVLLSDHIYTQEELIVIIETNTTNLSVIKELIWGYKNSYNNMCFWVWLVVWRSIKVCSDKAGIIQRIDATLYQYFWHLFKHKIREKKRLFCLKGI